MLAEIQNHVAPGTLRFARPLGLTTVRYGVQEDQMPNMAAGYTDAQGKVAPAQTIHMSVPHAAGALLGSVEDLARRLGKSRTSITESLSLNNMPEEVKNLCRLADISSKSLLLQVVRQPNIQKMTELVEKIASQGGATRAEVRQDLAKPKAGRPKAYVFSYRPESKAFNLKLKFRKGNVPRHEVIEALEAILRELRDE